MFLPLVLLEVPVRSHCPMCSVMELRPDSLTALFWHRELPLTAHIVKMLECDVSLVLKETSDLKVAIPPGDVWRSATTISGALCVMASGIMLMLK